MGITRCAADCYALSSAASCGSTWGCSWVNNTAATTMTMMNGIDSAQGSCSATSTGQAGGAFGTMWIGVILSIFGDIIINIGMNSMKHAHNIIKDGLDGTVHFAKVPWWWLGIFGIVGGETANLFAYGFAPASIVTPVGAVGVMTNIIITTYGLKERFHVAQLFGVICIIGGIVMVVYFAPISSVHITADNIVLDWIWQPQFVSYAGTWLLLLVISLLANYKYASRSVLVPISACSLIGSMTVVCAKTFSSLIATSSPAWTSPALYVSAFLTLATGAWSVAFVNSAMALHDNSLVVPTYYAFFTLASVGAAAGVYGEFSCVTGWQDSLCFAAGIMITVFGVVGVNVGRCDMDDEDSDEADVEKERLEAEGMKMRASMVWGGGLSGAISAYPVKGKRRTICDPEGDKGADGDNQRRMTFVPIVNTPVGATRPSQRASVASVRKSIVQSLASLATLSAPDATEPRTSMFQGFSAAAASLFTPRDKDADRIHHRRSLGDVENGDKNRSSVFRPEAPNKRNTLSAYGASPPPLPENLSDIREVTELGWTLGSTGGNLAGTRASLTQPIQSVPVASSSLSPSTVQHAPAVSNPTSPSPHPSASPAYPSIAPPIIVPSTASPLSHSQLGCSTNGRNSQATNGRNSQDSNGVVVQVDAALAFAQQQQPPPIALPLLTSAPPPHPPQVLVVPPPAPLPASNMPRLVQSASNLAPVVTMGLSNTNGTNGTSSSTLPTPHHHLRDSFSSVQHAPNGIPASIIINTSSANPGASPHGETFTSGAEFLGGSAARSEVGTTSAASRTEVGTASAQRDSF